MQMFFKAFQSLSNLYSNSYSNSYLLKTESLVNKKEAKSKK